MATLFGPPGNLFERARLRPAIARDTSKELTSIDFGMLATKNADGAICSRPMSNNGDLEYDGASWFFYHGDSRKIVQCRP